MRRALRALAAAGALCLAVAAHAQAGRVPMPHLEVDRSTSCVDSPEVMRRKHMEMLRHRRDRTVHLGVRGGDEALTRCLECHASRTTGAAIGSRDAFCQSCHDFVGVKLDCFDCHQGKPGAVAKRPDQR